MSEDIPPKIHFIIQSFSEKLETNPPNLHKGTFKISKQIPHQKKKKIKSNLSLFVNLSPKDFRKNP